MSFKSQVVIVTGSSSGIGATVATNFAKEGADVVLVGRNVENLQKVYNNCAVYGRKPLIVKADVTNDDDLKKIVTNTIEKFGKINVVVNSAGILRAGTLEKGDILDAFDALMSTNVRSVVSLVKLATPYLIASKGNVVNVSSVGGQQIFAEFTNAYSVSKAAIDMFTRGAAIELGKHGVRVNVVSPGPVNHTNILVNAGFEASVTATDVGFRSLLGRWSEPQEIADIVLFLASDKAKGVTGSNYVCDNGYLNVKHCKN